jgi:hypothetical protein
VDLGVDAWYANQLGELEVVAVDRLCGHFVLAPISVKDTDLWITVAFDHVRISFRNCPHQLI